ncbi:zinc-binding dehydrogenase [Chelativorans sp. ZYF759]|uniref:zinc-binding dehydrogenase n=1 Tax=Chelativorans sp. ZYF759 TaxID=2692213 RepID=UPI00145F6B77|nr:zinc-binding dehydrogenase [Chelativorans sp. ZYF759]NMG41674.1 zinc-binding dehydrogenase [Chelativorans sp. ZYF759]
MKALVLNEAKGPQSVVVQEEPTPSPKTGEVRVAIRAASLNHRELWISRGQYPGMNLPCILGADGAGVVDAVGEGVDGGLVGKEVVLYPALNWGDSPDFPSKDFCLLGMPVPGTIADFICVPAENVFEKPASLSFEQAAALPTAALTAWRAVTVKARVKPGDKVLITGIGGGVAMFALKFCVALNAEVYVTSGDESNLAKAAELGAAGGFNYRDEDWGKAARKTAGGFDVVIDGAPAAAYGSYARALSFGAKVVIYGSTRGPQFTLNAPELFLRHATVFGTAMGNLDDFRGMLDFVGDKQIKPVIDRTVTIANAGEAFDLLESNHFGKIVITL